MRLQKSVIHLLLIAFLWYYATIAQAALSQDGRLGPAATAVELCHLLPRLAVPDCLVTTVALARRNLKAAMSQSWLMRDTRPSDAQARHDFAVLWAPLEPAPVAANGSATPGDAPLLLPGQD